tara:strand:- start:163 stop:1062 length:900 start_codon:yes stop_codon:yes gene_type:complete
MAGKKGIIIAVVLCVCLLIVSIGGYFVYEGSNNDEDGTDADGAGEDEDEEEDEPLTAEEQAVVDKITDEIDADADAEAGTTNPGSTGGGGDLLADDSSEDDDSGDEGGMASVPTPNRPRGRRSPAASGGASGGASVGASVGASGGASGGAPTPASSTASTGPVGVGSLPADEEETEPQDPLELAFLEGGTGKFNRHMPGYCRNWKKKDQNSGDKNYGKQTIAECKKLCFDGNDLKEGQTITACEWGKGDVTSETERSGCVGHTADINRFEASGHDNRICWTGAAPDDYDGNDERLYGKQ